VPAPGSLDLIELDLVLRPGGVRVRYQPIVELDLALLPGGGSPRIVGYEALVRGPVGSPYERAGALLSAARSAGRLAEVDALSHRVALREASERGVSQGAALFLNCEPASLRSELLDELHELLLAQSDPPSVVLEITERALTSRPAELVTLVRRARRLGFRIALDDVGSVRSSLALLPFLEPDVVKLDLSVVHHSCSAQAAETAAAVTAYAESTGALVLAEGIETPEHARTARALGARLGQGWLFGRPASLLFSVADLAEPLPEPLRNRPVAAVPRSRSGGEATPWQLVASSPEVRRASKPVLLAVARQLERQALLLGDLGVIHATFQHSHYVTGATRQRYAELGEKLALVAMLGEQLPAEPAPGVRGVALTPEDPLAREWDVVVVGPHFAAALLACDLGDSGADDQRRFDYVLTYNRELVLRAASCLIRRLPAEPVAAGPPVAAQPARSTPAAVTGRVAAWSRPPVLMTLPAAGLGLLERALTASTNGVTIVDALAPDHPLIYLNPAFERLAGYRAEQLLGRNCRILQGPDTDPAAVALLRERIAAGQEVRTRLLNYRSDGTSWWNEVHLSPVRDSSGELTHYVGIQQDVTERMTAEQRLNHLAFSDALTGLPNRARLLRHLDLELSRATRSGTGVALLFCDLDGFKQVNDRYGHIAGDALLVALAARLRRVVRAEELLARYGGDEFLVVASGFPADASTTASVVRRIRTDLGGAFREPFALPSGHVLQMGASIGASAYPCDAHSVDSLLSSADREMYAVKATGYISRS